MKTQIIILFLAIFLVSCASVSTPVPTSTSTHIPQPTETFTPEPTATSEPTATPEPTKVPMPEGWTTIVESNQMGEFLVITNEKGEKATKIGDDWVDSNTVVETDKGSVFVRDNKLMVYDPETKRATETTTNRVTFADVRGAGKIVKALHPEEFLGDQKALHDFLLPSDTLDTGKYNFAVDYSRWAGDYIGVELPGKGLGIVNIKHPDGVSGDTVSVMMLAMYGADKPIPIVVGTKIDGKQTSFLGTGISVAFNEDAESAKGKGITADSLDTFDEKPLEFYLPFGLDKKDSFYPKNIRRLKMYPEYAVMVEEYLKLLPVFEKTLRAGGQAFNNMGRYSKENSHTPSGTIIQRVMDSPEIANLGSDFVGFPVEETVVYIRHH